MHTIKKGPGFSMDKNVKTIENSSLMNTYNRYPIEFVSGEGPYLYDNIGKKYLDFFSGIAVTGFGHNNIKLVNKAVNQIMNYWHVSNLFIIGQQESLAKKLTKLSGLDKVFLCNSGTEANEAAIKFARKWGRGRSDIITALGGFHGRTLGSLSASAQVKLWDGFQPLTPGFKYVPFNDIEAIEYSITKNTLAILIEPIQGENGIVVPSDDYLQNIRKICDKYNLLMIIDEIQTGVGRTGKYFAYQWSKIIPDIVTVAKGIANGLPLAAVICNNKVSESISPGSHGSTFGGNPVAVAVASEVMDMLTDELLTNIHTLGSFIKENVQKLNYAEIKAVRGKGLMIGIEFDSAIDVKDIASDLLASGIIVGTAGNNVLRLLPPFLINKYHISLFANKLSKVLKTKNEFINN